MGQAPRPRWEEPNGADTEFDPEVRPAELVFRDASFVICFVPKLHLLEVNFGPEERLVSVLLPENAPIGLLYLFRCGAAFE
jgi:hypothetical protein